MPKNSDINDKLTINAPKKNDNKPLSYNSTVLFVNDIEKSKEFYTNIMGEEIEIDLGINIGFKSGLAIWKGDYARNVIFNDSDSGSDSKPKHKNSDDMDYCSKNMLEIYYETDDMEKTYNTLKNSGCLFVHEIKKQPWCQLTLRILDPDGHMIEIGERMDVCIKRLHKFGMKPNEIAEKTTMPIDIVNFMLD
ncbi:VOC family protein [Methanomicrobium antiquum]|uniref:VOC family protein n=1 Tax=Methanomicrobium antiquum TaxID=487686 RepID=A0AAF0JMM0_9EURY|nr:VOC family protein [Methanomicrobium antiquum]MDD3978102.1 VOC family protein [Methanomicrobium sp.]WFN36685.1 VOC family protein [Methanomicrobium antiquum]